MKTKSICQWCDSEYTGTNAKFCSRECLAAYREELKKVRAELGVYSKSRRSAWNRKNRQKVNAMTLANQNPHKLAVLRECEHAVPEKIKHHPDYNFPYRIELLCPACHRAEHKRLRSLAH